MQTTISPPLGSYVCSNLKRWNGWLRTPRKFESNEQLNGLRPERANHEKEKNN